MKEIPPLLAKAIARRSSETDCMIADENGMFSDNAGVSFLRYFVIGTRRFTLSGICSLVVRLGRSKNSRKVLDGLKKYCAMAKKPLFLGIIQLYHIKTMLWWFCARWLKPCPKGVTGGCRGLKAPTEWWRGFCLTA